MDFFVSIQLISLASRENLILNLVTTIDLNVSIQLISLASRELNADEPHPAENFGVIHFVSIQLISLASREQNNRRSAPIYAPVSIQLISLASREVCRF